MKNYSPGRGRQGKRWYNESKDDKKRWLRGREMDNVLERDGRKMMI